jgi:hypothetical protein
MTPEDGSPSVTSSDTSAPPTGPDSSSVATTPAQPQSTDATPAPSSSADPQAESKESLLDHVLKSLPAQGEDPDKLTLPHEATPTSDKPSSEPGEAETTETLPDLTPEEMARFSSRTRTRIKQLVAERDTARTELTKAQGDAQVAHGLREYLSQNDITKEDFSLLIDLGAALRKGDFRSFYAGIRPYVDLAEEALGITLPPDLAQRVQQGHMTTEAARQFSQERMSRQVAESQAQRLNQEQTNFLTQTQRDALGNAVHDTIINWEKQVASADPDYGHKQGLMKDLLWSVIRETGAPQNPQHAVQIANEAYRRVNEQVARFRPPPRATQPSPSSVHRATGVTPEPKSLMEAAMIGLDRARRSA